MQSLTKPMAMMRHWWLPIIILATTAVIVTPMAMAINVMKTRLTTGVGESLALAAADIAGKLDLLLAERYGDIQVMAKTPVFRGQDRAAMRETLAMIQEAYPVYLWLGVTDAQGRLIAATDHMSPRRNMSERPWFKAVKDRGTIAVLDAAETEESGGMLAVSIAAPVQGPHGKLQGVVAALVGVPVLEDVIVRTVVALQAQHGTEARIEYQFMRKDGTLIADSLLREEGRVNLKAMGLRSAHLIDAAPAGFIEETHARRREPVITGYARTQRSGYDFGLEWGILLRMDAREVLAPVTFLLWKLAAAGGILCLPLLGYLVWSTVRLNREWTRSESLIGDLRMAEAKLSDLAYYDQLTGLPNRRLFMELLPRAIARVSRTDRLGALLFLDMDRFKLINDTFGHVCADLLLSAFASRLKGCIRGADTVARLGGDEFTVLLEGLSWPEEAAGIAQRILNATAKPFEIQGREIFVSTSIGIATFASEHMSPDTLIANADMAMYEAKTRRGVYRFFSPSMKSITAERVDLEASLRQAVERNELVLHYQPQIDLRRGAVVGVEALVRWQHATHGLLHPGAFIGLAEETGLIVQVGEWVLRTACRQVKAWHEQGATHLRLAVNLSRAQMQCPNLVDLVRQVLEETGLAPACLELEITETLLIRNGDVALETLHALHGLGVRLSVDDFGTGYSSLNYIKNLPVHALKIDQSFVRDMVASAKDAMIVKTIVSLARALDLDIMAEGVETAEQRDLLLAEQCFAMQGYYFGRPAPAEDMSVTIFDCTAGELVG
ncbi:MAG: EAL domain-containing protein [Nitrospirota bacterium]